jgi:LuxR family maltose regulon positive regulatory protein
VSSTLLTTKLFTPPARPNLVPRPQLVQKLDQGLMMGQRLTLVSAPAGYGKTTLVSTWLQTSEQRFTWLSLDAGDDDLARFFAYLVAALQKIAVGLELTVRDLLEEPQLPPVETLVTALINDIAATPTSATTLPPPGVPGQRFVLVLDDYHVITETAIHEALDLLVERLVPHVHLVIASRRDPPLALSRLRGRGQVTEIRQQNLAG